MSLVCFDTACTSPPRVMSSLTPTQRVGISGAGLMCADVYTDVDLPLGTGLIVNVLHSHAQHVLHLPSSIYTYTARWKCINAIYRVNVQHNYIDWCGKLITQAVLQEYTQTKYYHKTHCNYFTVKL